MGISELINGFISTPGKLIHYVQENVLKSPQSLKRRREDSKDGGKQEHRTSRLKLSLPEPDDKTASRLATLAGTTSIHHTDGVAAAGEVVSPPAPWLKKQRAAQTKAHRSPSGGQGRSSAAIVASPAAAAAQPRPLELWSSIRARRHGPQTGFRPFHSTATPATTAAYPIMAPEEEESTRQRILQEVRLASEADVDADLKAKQAQAKRAELLFKLKQSELKAVGGSPQPLGGQMGTLDNEQIARRLDMSISSAGPTHGSTPPVRPSHLAQSSPADSFFMSATPLHEQQERALRQVLQEEEQADRKAQELAQVKAAYEETKARLRKAEENVQMIMDRAKREMEGTDPASSSRRSLGQALALDIKLAEEERRRLEAQRQHRELQFAVAQPLNDEAPVAPGIQGALRRTESPGDSASSHQQQRQVLKPVFFTQPQARDRKPSLLAKVAPKQPEEAAVVLLSSDDEDEEDGQQQQEEEEPDEENESEEDDEEEEEQEESEGEQEMSLSKALDDVHVGKAAARQLSKKHRALAQKGLGPGPAEEIVAYHKPSNIEMPRRLLRCLRGLDWLNDEVINIYMGLLQVRDAERRKAGLGPKCHFFNSFFVNKLWKDAGAYCYANVARWTAQKKLEKQGQLSETVLEVDRIIMPVHLGNHWTCATIDLAAKELVYYDSMGGRHMDIMKALRRYVSDEYANKLEKTVDTFKWKIRFPTDIPYQTNGSDCGVFALQYAEHVSRDAAFDFDQQDMPILRLKTAADIVSLTIL